MKYANFSTLGRMSVNIGDYLQFIVTDYLYSLMGVDENEVVRISFDEVETYDGEAVILPFCYSFIYFVKSGKISISNKIKSVFLAVTLSTIDQFMNLDEFFSDDDNRAYFLKHSPVGCRDEITYNIFVKYGIPAYIHGCMTAIFPKYSGSPGKKTLFIDAPKSLLPFIPDSLFDEYEFSTQQYYLDKSDCMNYRKIFEFVRSKYQYYRQTAKLVVTSRLHVALPLTAFGIPVILAKDHVDGRFSFIEAYLPIYSRENYGKINWSPCIPDMENMKELLIEHAVGRIRGNMDQSELIKREDYLTNFFMSRKIENDYKNSHTATHKNGDRFDEYAAQYWNKDEKIKYALWGATENNAEYWKNHIETHYPNAELAAVFDSFREGELFRIPYQHPEKIIKDSGIYIIVCSVGAADAALKLFKELNIDKSRYCITSDCFISGNDIEEREFNL